MDGWMKDAESEGIEEKHPKTQGNTPASTIEAAHSPSRAAPPRLNIELPSSLSPFSRIHWAEEDKASATN
jgi:hypothetical protein